MYNFEKPGSPEELMHWGILGMKWGRRRYQNLDGSLTEAGRKRYGKETKEKKRRHQMREDVKNRKTLSLDTLKKKVERIKMEKQLKDLTAEELSPGKKAALEILSSSGKKILTSFATGAGLYLTKAAMTKTFDIKELASYMTPKPKNK